MMNNPIMQLVSMVKNGANPRNMIQQMANNNPQFAHAYRTIQGKSEAELQQMVINMCNERGITPQQLRQQIGL